MYNSRLYYNQNDNIKKTNNVFGTPTMQKNMFDIGVGGYISGGYSFNRGSLMNRRCCLSGGNISMVGVSSRSDPNRKPLPQMLFEPTTLYVNGNSGSLPDNRVIRSGGKMTYPKPLINAIKQSKTTGRKPRNI